MAQPQTTGATTAQGEAHNVGFPPFDPSHYGGQLLWLAITFGALYFLMSRVVLPRLSGTIETRRMTIAGDLDQAAAMKTRAEEAGAAYEKSLAEARANAQALARETSDRLSAETEAKRKALEADLAGRLAQAETTITARKTEAMGNVRAIAAEAAGAIVERLTGRLPDPATIEAALDRPSPR